MTRKKPQRPNRINVDLTPDMLAAIDAVSDAIGVPRQSWIKMQLASALASHGWQDKAATNGR